MIDQTWPTTSQQQIQQPFELKWWKEAMANAFL
jgi:hypothetical protein